MKYYNKHIIFSFVVAFPVFFINIGHLAYANSVSALNIMATVLFLIAWIIYSFNVGYNRKGNFILFSILFWGMNIGTVVIQHYFPDNILVYFPLYLAFAPMYALYYAINQLSITVFLNFILLIVTILTCSIIGYLVGLKKKVKVLGK